MSAKEPKKDSEWIQHVKNYAKEHGIPYAKAMTASKPSYVKPEVVPKLVSAPRKPKTQKQEKQSHPDKKTRKSPNKAEVSAQPAPAPPSPPRPPVVEHETEPAVLVETDEPDLIAIARTIKNKVCKEKLDTTQHNLREARNAYDSKVKECEEILYGDFVNKYFKDLETNNLTHEGLLNGLQQFYKDSKKSNPDYSISMGTFIHLFSQKTAVPGANYKRQHIFEALCRLLLLFNYDRNIFGIKKEFYTSLEDFSSQRIVTDDKAILKTPVNVSSKAGIVDIFFRTENTGMEQPVTEGQESDPEEWGCECINTISERKIPSKKYNYIMIQNKYYEVEKSSIGKYDVQTIYTLYKKYQDNYKIFNDGEAKIVLMVNNEDSVSSNLMRAKQQYNGLLEEVIGVKRLNDWFQDLLFALLKSRTIADFKKHVGVKADATKPLLQTRFHQKFIIDCTEKYIEKEGEDSVSKFIWGAVPRSGKSYMIGGLIRNRLKHPENQKNDIVIILGAKTETESQFVKMFKEFEDFSHYNIFVGGSDDKPGKQQDQVAGKPTIYLFSQEYLKMKCVWPGGDNPESLKLSNFNEHIPAGAGLKSRFENKSIDLYFDEIHKGGSTDNSKSVIYTFKNNKVSINIFVMVTATFAKPSSKYTDINFIGSGNSTTEIIEWSYNDQQNMKKITDATKLEMFVNTRTDVQKGVLEETFRHYHEYYGASYLTVLTGEYSKYPELVLLSPQSIEIVTNTPFTKMSNILTDDIRNIFIENLQCSACKIDQTPVFYRMPSNVFKDPNLITNVLDFMSGPIRNHMAHMINYPIMSPHTELWFLPDKNLYPSGSDCKSNGCKPVEIELHDEGDDAEKEAKTGIANIEPVTRGLSFMLTDNSAFNHYNVFIVHNTPFNYLNKDITSEKIFGDKVDKITGNRRIGVYDNNKKKGGKKMGLSDQIKAFERQSYKDRKSVIILTGAKLRLGISLPCADIAFNFDDIKSIDANYQTMFRVLTEREKPEVKKYGYYFDFNKDRSIQFLYEYNKTYGGAKNKSSITENLQELQHLLFTFNYNGLNIIQRETTSEVGLYNKLITELKLNQEGYNDFWSKKENIVSQLKRTLSISENEELMKELYKVLKMSKVINAPKETPAIVLNEGKPREKMPHLEREDESSDEEADEEAVAEVAVVEDYGDVINHIAENLPTIIVLLAMFSTTYKPVCENIEECLQHSVDNILKGASRCTCENIMKKPDGVNSVDIMDCFFNSGKLLEGEEASGQTGGGGKAAAAAAAAKGGVVAAKPKLKRKKASNAGNTKYTPEDLKRIMEILLQFVRSKGEKNEASASTINNIFDTIREAVNTMPKSKERASGRSYSVGEDGDGKHGLIYGMTVADVEQKILSYLSVRQEEKDKFGEVFTPMKLINEMFDKLPHAVWSDPDKKWLDPANGIGNFPMVAYMRLMDGLDKTIPDKQKRSKHIIEKMLYMVELNPKNVKISRRIFGSNANICCADFLKDQDKVMRDFGVELFDVIIGNPPFQKEQEGKREGGYGGRTLWDQFIKKSLDILKKGGLLGFITPPPWRKPEHELYDIMTKDNQLLYLHIFNKKQGQDLFHVSQRIDLYIIEKTRKYKHTAILDEKGDSKELDLSKWKFLPNYAYKSIQKIMTSEEHGIKIIYSSSIYETRKPYVKTTESDKYKHKIVHGITQDGIVFWYTDDNTKGHFGVSKVLLNFNENQYPVNDYEGKYGMSQITFGIPITSKKEGDDIVRAINSDEFKEIIKATKWGAFQTDWRMFKYFRPDFYKQFLGKTTASTKIQSVVRGHQQRQKTRREGEDKKGGGSIRRRHLRTLRVRKTQNQRHTRKNRIFGFF